jgi:hypothetical protein
MEALKDFFAELKGFDKNSPENLKIEIDRLLLENSHRISEILELEAKIASKEQRIAQQEMRREEEKNKQLKKNVSTPMASLKKK